VKDDIDARLADLRTAVQGARAVPMSASVMVNKIELNALLDALEAAVDDTLSHATEVVEGRDAFLDTGRLEAIEMLREAEQRSEDLASDTGMFRLAQLRAEEVRREADREAAALRAETDQYVEEKLANLEHTVEKTVDRVRAARAHLVEEGVPDSPELRAETDQYVAEKLADFQAALESLVGVLRKGRAQLAGGHVHALGDDADVAGMTLPDHLQR
jgi:cell division septum initiation protein DivIVA